MKRSWMYVLVVLLGMVTTAAGVHAKRSETAASLSVWMINTSQTSAIMRYNGSPILVNVQSAVEGTDINGNAAVIINATGMPNYTYTVTQADINKLNSRPNASTDFVDGHTTATPGQTLAFGQNIGFRSETAVPCPVNQGYGFWPPGPGCPTNVSWNRAFPANPSPSATHSTVPGQAGLWINGTGMYNWSDDLSYNNQGIWRQIAYKFEVYAMDLCLGHAPGTGDYHNHSYPPCLTKQLNDNGTGHSPVYGVADDGYLVYGPWHANGVVAVNGWKTRNYMAGSPTGCGANYKRTCKLVDQYDISKGTTPSTAGPDTTATVNQFQVSSGFYYEDYYYSACTVGPQCLDRYNGHSHGTLGYHYHVSVNKNPDGSLTPLFPYTIGPTFYGK